jgi:RhtB (resistance to homoserine/threonine) family protein
MGSEFQSITAAGALFFLGLVSPGPNFLVVIESTLRGGRRSGIFTGLGASTGDGLYALIGLLGFSTLSSQGESLFQALKIFGSGYLMFLGVRMWLRRSAVTDDLDRHQLPGIWRCFLRGLATDLSNPKTILFFGSIFAVALHRDTPSWVKAAIWSEVVLISVLWRLALCRIFSMPALRNLYAKYALMIERFFGALLILLGWRVASGVGDPSRTASTCHQR